MPGRKTPTHCAPASSGLLRVVRVEEVVELEEERRGETRDDGGVESECGVCVVRGRGQRDGRGRSGAGGLLRRDARTAIEHVRERARRKRAVAVQIVADLK